MSTQLSQHDLDTLHRLAERKAEISQDPVNRERREAWYKHDAGTDNRPMVLAEIGGIRDQTQPIPESTLQCTDPWARGLEKGLRVEIYQFDVLGDDHVVEPWINTRWQVQASDYGARPVHHQPDNEGHLGARRWDAPIQDLDRDFHLLKPRTFTVDREVTHTEKKRLETVFAPILPVRIRGGFWWTMGMTWTAIELIGLEGLMMSMYDNPQGLHRLMAFLRDDNLSFASWLEAEGLLTLNDENDYIGSGSMGYTRELPQAGHQQDEPARMGDQWLLLESQETVGVGPDQFAEFVFPYQQVIGERFGKVYYGCCEPVHNRLHVIEQLSNLARISVSPWCDEEFMARKLGDRIAYSRKPNPTLISTPVFDEDAIRADLRHTLEVTRGCRVELAMKDVHTLDNQPERLPRWVDLARQVIDEVV